MLPPHPLILLLPIVLLRMARGDWADLTVEPGTVTNVWGFCQGALAAPVAGGWVNNASGKAAGSFAAAAATLRRDSTCHMGMSGSGASSNFSLMPSNTCALTESARAHTCNCIGVPQCGRGSKCKFDCSCNVLSLRNRIKAGTSALENATLPRMLSDPDARPVFVGSIKFKDGNNFNVECALPLDFRNTTANQTKDRTVGQQYLHGYEILIRGRGRRDRRCPESESKPPVQQPLTMNSKYDCAVTPILSDRPIAVGDLFQQKYAFSRASRLGSHGWLYLVLVLLHAIVVIHM